jgi:hypothetical protein
VPGQEISDRNRLHRSNSRFREASPKEPAWIGPRNALFRANSRFFVNSNIIIQT